MFELKSPQDFKTKDETGKSSAQILVATDGFGIVTARGSEPVTFARGDAVVIPAELAEFTVQPQWSLEFLKSYVPASEMPEPVTRM
jgi:mannose-6-phosphate isomerase class I